MKLNTGNTLVEIGLIGYTHFSRWIWTCWFTWILPPFSAVRMSPRRRTTKCRQTRRLRGQRYVPPSLALPLCELSNCGQICSGLSPSLPPCPISFANCQWWGCWGEVGAEFWNEYGAWEAREVCTPQERKWAMTKFIELTWEVAFSNLMFLQIISPLLLPSSGPQDTGCLLLIGRW